MNKIVPIAVVVLLATLGLSAYAYTYYLPGLNGSTSSTGPSGLGGPGTGTLNIYLSDSPHTNATLKYLLVNVTSVTLKYSSFANESTTTETTSATSSTSSSSSSSTSTSTTSSSSSSSTSTTSSSSGQNATEHRFVFVVPSSVGTNVNITKLQGNSLFLGAPKVPAGNVTGIIFQITGAKAFWTNGNSTTLKVVANGKFMVPVLFVVHADGTTTLTIDITPNSIHISQGNASVLTPVIHVKVESTGSNGTTETTETTQTETSSSTSG